MEKNVIKIENLKAAYGKPGPKQVQALRGISFEVERGEIFGLLGPNGAGKTTLLSVLEGLMKPASGKVTVNGRDAVRHSSEIRRLLGTQLQHTALVEELTVRELVHLYAALYQVYLSTEQVASLLERFGLNEKAQAYPRRLSGGQRQRLALAVAITHDPQIVLLDEPTGALDPQARREIWALIHGLHEEGRTVILTTHSMEEAEALCRRVAIIDRGELVAVGAPTRLIATLESGTIIKTDLELPVDLILPLPGVIQARYTGQRLEIETGDPDKTLKALSTLARQHKRRMGEVSLRQPNLEDVFLHLTGRPLEAAK